VEPDRRGDLERGPLEAKKLTDRLGAFFAGYAEAPGEYVDYLRCCEMFHCLRSATCLDDEEAGWVAAMLICRNEETKRRNRA
jgi:hypothetical protein